MSEYRPRFDRYEIREEVSRGSMGVVYRAFDPILRREVAIKVLAQGRCANEDDIARFMREARVVARLSHPNIVPVHEVGEHEGSPYFTMDFIDGKVLSRVLREGGSLQPRRAVQIVNQVAVALLAAHAKGLIHRDIKPSNVMLTNDGHVLLMDFGLAKDMSADTVRTQSGTTIGTPAYMPPEQARGETAAIGVRSDVYSLGAVLFECLTGRAPFEGEGMVEVVMRVLEDPPPLLRKLNSRIPRDLETIVLKCLEKSPDDRYPSMVEFQRDLQHYLEGEAIEAHRVGIVRRAGRKIARHGKLLAGLLTGAAIATFLIALLIKYGAPTQPEKSESLALSASIPQDGELDPAVWRTNAGYLDYDAGAGILRASLTGKEVVVQELYYGNFRAVLDFLASEGKGSLGLKVFGQEGVMFMAALGPDGILRLVGPMDLEDYSPKRPFNKTRLLAAARAGPLAAGKTYRLELRRSNMGLSVYLIEAPVTPSLTLVPPLAHIEYKGLQLSNWHNKNEQVGVFGVGERMAAGELKIWLEIPGFHTPLASANDRFYRGDYNGARSAYQALVQDNTARPDIRLKAMLHLAFYHEIKYEYPEALNLLDRVIEGLAADESQAELFECAWVRRAILLTKMKEWRMAADAYRALEHPANLQWKWEFLPAAETMLLGGQMDTAVELYSACAEIYPPDAIPDRLKVAAYRLIDSGELAYAVLFLEAVHYPGRMDALNRLVEKARSDENGPALIKACSLLAEEAHGPQYDKVVASLASVAVDTAGTDPVLLKELVARLGGLRREVTSRALWLAVGSGRFREFGTLLSLGRMAAPLPGESLNETAAALLKSNRYADVLDVYAGTPADDLLPYALSAAEQLVDMQMTGQVEEFLNSLAARGRIDDRVVQLSNKCAQIAVRANPLPDTLVNHAKGPFFVAKNLPGLLRTLVVATPRERRPYIVMQVWEKMLAEHLETAYPALVEASAEVVADMEGPLPWREAESFTELSEKFIELAGGRPAALLALADLMCIMEHPEKAAVLWEKIAFQKIGATRSQIGNAAFMEGLYFQLTGDGAQAGSFLRLAGFSGWKYSGYGADTLDRFVKALQGGDRRTALELYGPLLKTVPDGAIKSLLMYYSPLWQPVPHQPPQPETAGEPADEPVTDGKEEDGKPE
ncbi:MAG: serine/threonine protein kinase [Planctomycetes bacterium]|nr:serine/threonine protein kinase [Planctomycetota bacterium]